MWTAENRPRYNRDKLRYPSDLTDQEWALIAPLIPPAKRGGGKRRVDMREVVNAVMYILSTGCQWRYLPKTCRPKAPCMITSACGTGMARWIASIMRSTSSVGRKPSAKPKRHGSAELLLNTLLLNRFPISACFLVPMTDVQRLF